MYSKFRTYALSKFHGFVVLPCEPVAADVVGNGVMLFLEDRRGAIKLEFPRLAVCCEKNEEEG